MDKTTTWLVRGASAIVIIFGLGYFAKPQINRLTNYLSELKEDKRLTEKEKDTREYRLAKERCLNLKEISYSEFIEKLNQKKIKKWYSTPLGAEIHTSKGIYIVKENINNRTLPGLDAEDILFDKKIYFPQKKMNEKFNNKTNLPELNHKYWKITCR